jgi:hypothetical protein
VTAECFNNESHIERIKREKFDMIVTEDFPD